MPINQILTFGTGAGANVLSPTDYAALAARLPGFSSGVAKSVEVNTTLRQAAFIATMIAQFTADKSGADVLDDGDLAALQENFEAAILAFATGRLIGVRLITTNMTYNASPGTNSVLVLGVSGGGPGGGAVATSSTQSSAGGGGSNGSWALGYYTSDFNGVLITCGAAGVGIVGAIGTNGGVSSFGPLMTLPGGLSGSVGNVVSFSSSSLSGLGAPSPAAPTGALLNMRGQPGGNGMVFPAGSQQGPGGNGPMGTGGQASSAVGASAASGLGAGGSGALNGISSAARAGGNGSPGGFLLLELS